MINKIIYIESDTENPYENFAIEEQLLLNVDSNTCILFLWQNAKTVVIGKNQNCIKECNVSQLISDGGFIARRLSGGGAVFHDSGNLNFTFITNKKNSNVEKQTEVILRTIKKFGIDAKRTGRNDITVNQKKFSGHAFYSNNNNSFHHGTIMLSVDTDILSRYLNVDVSKLKSKGVDSVKSRVVNLCSLNPDITIKKLKTELVKTFSDIYKLPIIKLYKEDLNSNALKNSFEKFSSWNWIYGKSNPFDYEVDKRFSWGNFNLQVSVKKGIVTNATIYSDCLMEEVISCISKCIIGCRFEKNSIIKSIKKGTKKSNIIDDVVNFLENEEVF